MAEFVKKQELEKSRARQINSAFVGYQYYLVSSGKTCSFDSYLNKLGIGEKKTKKLTKKQKQYYKNKADKIVGDVSKIKKWRNVRWQDSFSS